MNVLQYTLFFSKAFKRMSAFFYLQYAYSVSNDRYVNNL